MELKNENIKNKKSKLLDYIIKDIEDEKNRKEKLENRAILILSFLGITCATLLNSKLFEIFFNFLKKYTTLEEKIITIFFILIIFILISVILLFSFSILYNDVKILSMSELINKYNLVLDDEDKYIKEILNFYSKLKEYNEKNFKNFRKALTSLVVLLTGGVFLFFILLYLNNFSYFF
ncbi:hypothetical protein AB6N29_00600 [Fusobacterium animalis]|uniref:hypothetical protein n=1 Tax=Fusobacterium animalis TaxID=76859 RepID=UPI0030D0C0A9